MNTEKMMAIWEFLNENKKFFEDLESFEFGALICMFLEEYCRAKELDVVEFATTIAEKVQEVNADLGRYE